jgi:hypothetical protein
MAVADHDTQETARSNGPVPPIGGGPPQPTKQSWWQRGWGIGVVAFIGLVIGSAIGQSSSKKETTTVTNQAAAQTVTQTVSSVKTRTKIVPRVRIRTVTRTVTAGVQTTQVPATTSAPSSAGPIMPNVVGKNLDAATGELDNDGIRYALNSNGKHVMLKFDWGVCSTSPAPGQAVTGVVVLNLGHFTCEG